MSTDLLLLANNVTSLALVVGCYLLTHAYSVQSWPAGRAVAGIWAAIGVNVMITAYVRNVGGDPRYAIVTSKLLFAALAGAYAHRVWTEQRIVDTALMVTAETKRILRSHHEKPPPD